MSKYSDHQALFVPVVHSNKKRKIYPRNKRIRRWRRARINYIWRYIIYLFLFRNHFILFRIAVDPEPMQGTLGLMQEPRMLGWQCIVEYTPFTHLFTLRQFSKAISPVVMFVTLHTKRIKSKLRMKPEAL